jgi:hypothetical protein
MCARAAAAASSRVYASAVPYFYLATEKHTVRQYDSTTVRLYGTHDERVRVRSTAVVSSYHASYPGMR